MSNEEKKNDWQERELGALWAKKSNNGAQYMTGHIERTIWQSTACCF